MRPLVAPVLVGALLLAGCGGGSGETQTVTVQQTVSAEPVTTTVEAEPAPEPTSQATTETAADEGTIAVPDVVGMDHQLAQDTMQAAGLYSLDEEDASGEGRMLLFDRNWTVVGQSPAAGAMVDADQRILLRSKKDDE